MSTHVCCHNGQQGLASFCSMCIRLGSTACSAWALQRNALDSIDNNMSPGLQLWAGVQSTFLAEVAHNANFHGPHLTGKGVLWTNTASCTEAV